MSLLPRTAAAWLLAAGMLPAQDVTFTIEATQDRAAIPDSVYGANGLGYTGATVNRHGGNRHTGFNWENNASNAGTDYQNQSDNYLGAQAGLGTSTTPGAVLQAWVAADRAASVRSLVTLPLAGYVAADMSGPVTSAQVAPSTRWKAVVAKKPSAFTLTPDAADGSVYLDEMVNFLVSKYGTAATGGVAAYNLDNEPGLWSGTHPRLHPAATRYDELGPKSAAAASAVTAVDPTAEIYGPTLYGWNDYTTLQNAPDAGSHTGTFGAWYLAQMKTASATAGRRLLHRFDLHWYPEATGDNRIVFGSSPGTTKDIDARLQAPRSLWDPAYVETSWITQYSTGGKAIRLLPRLGEEVAANYPGTGLALTEYNYGAADHISGGVAQADVLGILGQYSTTACYWPLLADNSYVQAAFKMYRNYDGAGAAYGTVLLEATASDNALGGIHAARRASGSLTVTAVAINRSRTADRSAAFAFTLPANQTLGSVKTWRLSGSGASVQAIAAPTLAGAGFTQTLPAMSATLYEVKLLDGVAAWQQQQFGPQAGNAAVAGDTADPDRDGLPNLLEYATGRPPLTADRAPVLTAQPTGSAQVQLRFPRRKSAGDVQVILQSTPDLLTWTDRDPATLTPTRTDLDGQSEQWTLTVNTTGPRQFYRLKIVR